MSNLTICIYGAASSNIDDIYIREAEGLGRELGRRGHSMIYGGGATGLMGACARGVSAAGGDVISVVPAFIFPYEQLNTTCTEYIETQTMGERKEIMESRADAFIIVPGGIGTLDEFFEILTLTALGQKNSPVILYNINGYFDELIQFLDHSTESGFIRQNIRDFCRICCEPEKALDMIEYFA